MVCDIGYTTQLSTEQGEIYLIYPDPIREFFLYNEWNLDMDKPIIDENDIDPELNAALKAAGLDECCPECWERINELFPLFA